jgi:hypothetical protein
MFLGAAPQALVLRLPGNNSSLLVPNSTTPFGRTLTTDVLAPVLSVNAVNRCPVTYAGDCQRPERWESLAFWAVMLLAGTAVTELVGMIGF